MPLTNKVPPIRMRGKTIKIRALHTETLDRLLESAKVSIMTAFNFNPEVDRPEELRVYLNPAYSFIGAAMRSIKGYSWVEEKMLSGLRVELNVANAVMLLTFRIDEPANAFSKAVVIHPITLVVYNNTGAPMHLKSMTAV